MPPTRYLPDIGTLMHWIQDEGLTHEQCAERVYRETGQRVTRMSISVALSRAGKTKPTPTHDEALPWKVGPRHQRLHIAQQLRNMSRRQRGQQLRERDVKNLANFEQYLEDDDCIVGYDPDSERGFWYIPARYKDNDGPFPVRRSPLRGMDARNPEGLDYHPKRSR